jgi:hypothetical protein
LLSDSRNADLLNGLDKRSSLGRYTDIINMFFGDDLDGDTLIVGRWKGWWIRKGLES